MRLPLALILLFPATALAQASGGPARNGNVYGHEVHQPAKAAVKAQERGAGVAPGHAAARRQDDALARLDRSILRRNGASTASAGAVAPRH